MKKLIVILLWFWILFWWFSYVSASWCFHDAINVVNKAWVITRWARVRNVACMYGSTPIWTLAAWTKVRIIWQTAWTKIVMPDGKIWRVWNWFVSETNDWSNVPAFPTNHNVKDYCDTTNLSHCPNPSPRWVEPTWYYRTVPNYNWSVPVVTSNPVVTSTPVVVSTVNLSPAMKKAVDGLVSTLMERLQEKMWDNSSSKKVL